MKLTLKIKLLPTDEQANLLLDTMKEANTVCNAISDVAWEKKIFNNFIVYKSVKLGKNEIILWYQTNFTTNVKINYISLKSLDFIEFSFK